MYNDIMLENIEIKPSTELIPDEYIHSLETTAVHIFASRSEDDQASAGLLSDTLRQHGYSMDESHEHCLDTDNIHEVLNSVCNTEQDPGGMMLYFFGWSREEGTIMAFDGQQYVNINVQEIVTKFTSYTCLQLKNKPKICIFHVKSPSKIQTDSVRFFAGQSYDLTYDSPAEADMLIIHKKTEKCNSISFTEQLCEKINKYGKAEDILTLLALMEFPNESRPLSVSTLTRKFYFLPNDHRGHHLHIIQMHEELMRYLDHISDMLANMERLARGASGSSSGSRNSTRTAQSGERRRLGSARSNGSVSADSAPKPRWRF